MVGSTKFIKYVLVVLVLLVSTSVLVESHWSPSSITTSHQHHILSKRRVSSQAQAIATISPIIFSKYSNSPIKSNEGKTKKRSDDRNEKAVSATQSSIINKSRKKHRLPLSMVSGEGKSEKTMSIERRKKAQADMLARQKQFYSLFAGGFAGAFSSTITCPIEVVKTQLQSSSTVFANAGGNPFKIASEIMKKEGVPGFFRGLPPTLVGIIPSRATYFWAYSTTKNFFVPLIGDDSPTHILAGIAAGVTSNTITNPIWMVKTRMQILADAATGQKAYRGYLDAIRTIYQDEGLKGFMKGISASYWGCSEGCIQFVTYEKLKKKLIKDNNVKKEKQGLPYSQELTPVQTLSCAAFSKFVATSLTYPHEVVRTRLREQARNGTFKYHTMWQSLRLIAKEEGRKGLYAGMGTHIARVVPNTAIMFLSYELINAGLNRREEKMKAALELIDEDMSTGFDEEEE